jgi:hypothetical protein
MRNLTERELAAIETRAELQFCYGAPHALRPEDVVDLVIEVRELWAQRTRLIALVRQHLDHAEAGR